MTNETAPILVIEPFQLIAPNSDLASAGADSIDRRKFGMTAAEVAV